MVKGKSKETYKNYGLSLSQRAERGKLAITKVCKIKIEPDAHAMIFT